MKKIYIAIMVTVLLLSSVTVHAGFDANYYANRYPDVVRVLGTDPDVLLNHYNTYGAKEGRYANAQEEQAKKGSSTTVNNNFDAAYYAKRYPDVVAAVGNDTNALINHYNTHGIKEGRYKNAQEEAAKKPSSTPVPTQSQKQEQPAAAPAPTVVTDPVEAIPGYSTYVDVNLVTQTVAYFENGVNKFQAPCVSGNTSLRRGTPTGVYSIITKVPGKYLVGPTWRCWVDRWMQFTTSAIGLHDASWRGSFGGEIYKTNGSHGCVNLSKADAYALYDLISVGTTVVVH